MPPVVDSIKDLADHIGVTTKTIRAWGMSIPRTQDGGYDVSEVAEWRTRVRVRKRAVLYARIERTNKEKHRGEVVALCRDRLTMQEKEALVAVDVDESYAPLADAVIARRTAEVRRVKKMLGLF